METTPSAVAPNPLHAPGQRLITGEQEGWQVRQIPINDPRLPYLACNGFFHLQLWHPEAGISLLSPSRLTNGAWELWSEQTGLHRLRCAGRIGEVLREAGLPALLAPCCLQRVLEQHVTAALHLLFGARPAEG